MDNWQETIDQNFEELYAKYNEMIRNANISGHAGIPG